MEQAVSLRHAVFDSEVAQTRGEQGRMYGQNVKIISFLLYKKLAFIASFLTFRVFSIKIIKKFIQHSLEGTMSLKIGDIATVISEDNPFERAQGKIVSINGTEVEFEIGPAKRFLLDYEMRRDGDFTVTVGLASLRKDEEWSLDNRLSHAFGSTKFLQVYTLTDALDPEKPCMRANCNGKRQQRIMVNVWGSALEYDVCDTCAAQFHGKWLEEFPVRQTDKNLA